MRIASIDIGTNTILLLIAEINTDGTISPLHDEQVIARLGKGVDEHRTISPETFRRAESFLSKYKTTCDQFHVDAIIAVGTSALRDARNKADFCSFILAKTGISIQILSGEEEAQWTYRGALSEFSGRSDRFTVIDIGGGSTELITGNHAGIHRAVSIDIGSVRITERFLRESPPTESSLAAAYDFIATQLRSERMDDIAGTFAIGVAGTVTTLAAMQTNIPLSRHAELSGTKLPLSEIKRIFDGLKEKSIEEIRNVPHIAPGREDIILAGVMILITVMEICNLDIINSSDRGLRYGIILREIERVRY
jgi:exopolyphosphatase/guanosine-5'-triphosphate,3'-diphosphate pyrophosphatase